MFCEMKSDSYHDFLACLSTAILCQNIVEDPRNIPHYVEREI